MLRAPSRRRSRPAGRRPARRPPLRRPARPPGHRASRARCSVGHVSGSTATTPASGRAPASPRVTPATQTAAADREQHRVHVGQLLGDLRTEGRLPGHGRRTSRRRAARGLPVAQRPPGWRPAPRRTSTPPGSPRRPARRSLDLHRRRGSRDEDRRRDAERVADVGDGQPVVAARRGHQAVAVAPARRARCVKAPRTLNEPACCSSSSFRVTRRPPTSTSMHRRTPDLRCDQLARPRGCRRTSGRSAGSRGPTYPRRMPRPVRVECRKWPDAPHWEFDGVLARNRRARHLDRHHPGHPARQPGPRLPRRGRPRDPGAARRVVAGHVLRRRRQPPLRHLRRRRHAGGVARRGPGAGRRPRPGRDPGDDRAGLGRRRGRVRRAPGLPGLSRARSSSRRSPAARRSGSPSRTRRHLSTGPIASGWPGCRPGDGRTFV